MGVSLLCLEGPRACRELNLPRFSPPTLAVTLAIYVLIYNIGEIVKNTHPPASVFSSSVPSSPSYEGRVFVRATAAVVIKTLEQIR